MSLRWIACVGLCVLLGATAAGAASDDPVSWQFDIGYSGISGDAGKVLDDGYSVGFGAVLRPSPKTPLGIRLDLTYDWWDVNPNEIPGAGVKADDGNANQWSVRAGLQYESSGDRAHFIAGVGIGGYRLHANITETILVPGYICDPYWWWYCYPGLVPGDVILADKTLTKFGYNASLGVVFPLDNSEFFIEGQYHWVNVDEGTFETYPITLGWRW